MLQYILYIGYKSVFYYNKLYQMQSIEILTLIVWQYWLFSKTFKYNDYIHTIKHIIRIYMYSNKNIMMRKPARGNYTCTNNTIEEK